MDNTQNFRKQRLGLVAAYMFAVLALVAFKGWRFMITPLNIPESGYVLWVPPGASAFTISRQLAKEGILLRERWFLTLVHLQGLQKRLKAGEYALKVDMRPYEVLRLIADGKVIQYAFTIIEGWTFQELCTALETQVKLEHSLQGLTADEIMARLGYAGVHPEGRFYPDTYYFSLGDSDLALMQRAYKKLQGLLNEYWLNRDQELPYKTPYEALILASIIQKESAIFAEYPEIAGVYIRRILKRMPLQADPTTRYGLGAALKGPLLYKHLKSPSLYNTYQHRGLPPTPIAMAGKDAIKAALHPKAGTTLYFVATGRGDHWFSTTWQEHVAAVARYQLFKKTAEKK